MFPFLAIASIGKSSRKSSRLIIHSYLEHLSYASNAGPGLSPIYILFPENNYRLCFVVGARVSEILDPSLQGFFPRKAHLVASSRLHSYNGLRVDETHGNPC